jgi:hypothetical protein
LTSKKGQKKSKTPEDLNLPIILLNDDQVEDKPLNQKQKGKKELVYDLKTKPKTKKKESK